MGFLIPFNSAFHTTLNVFDVTKIYIFANIRYQMLTMTGLNVYINTQEITSWYTKTQQKKLIGFLGINYTQCHGWSIRRQKSDTLLYATKWWFTAIIDLYSQNCKMPSSYGNYGNNGNRVYNITYLWSCHQIFWGRYLKMVMVTLEGVLLIGDFQRNNPYGDMIYLQGIG